MTEQEILGVAAQTERDGIKFYSSAATTAGSELAKKMFLSLAQEEEKHLEYIQELLAQKKLKHAPNLDMAKVRTVFTQLSKQERLATKTDTDRQALDLALQMEQQSYDYYGKYAGEAESADMRELCVTLMREENKHFRLFTNLKEYLERPGDWFMKEENWIFDGG
jgi:rubrerythrin